MKKALLIVVFTAIFTNLANCQENFFYEKIAFDFYKTSILDKSKSKIKLQEKLNPGATDPNWFPRCDKQIKITEIDTVFENRLNKSELTKINDNRFKLKKIIKKPEYVCVDKAVLLNKKIVLVNVNEVLKHSGVYYHIFMDLNGNILRYCKGGYIE